MTQRLICIAFVPKKVNPLEVDIIRLIIVPDLPSAVQAAFHQERCNRGLVVAAGCSSVFSVQHKHGMPTTQLRVTVTDSRDSKQLVTEDLWWDGESDAVDCEFDPNDWFENGQVDAEAKFTIKISSGRMENLRTRPRHDEKEALTFDAKVEMHMFPTPGPPKGLHVIHRTSNNLKVGFEPPDYCKRPLST